MTSQKFWQGVVVAMVEIALIINNTTKKLLLK